MIKMSNQSTQITNPEGKKIHKDVICVATYDDFRLVPLESKEQAILINQRDKHIKNAAINFWTLL